MQIIRAARRVASGRRHLLFIFAGNDHFDLGHEVNAAAKRQTWGFILKAGSENKIYSVIIKRSEQAEPQTQEKVMVLV